jgi:hypothetical protein
VACRHAAKSFSLSKPHQIAGAGDLKPNPQGLGGAL